MKIHATRHYYERCLERHIDPQYALVLFKEMVKLMKKKKHQVRKSRNTPHCKWTVYKGWAMVFEKTGGVYGLITIYYHGYGNENIETETL